MVFLWEKYPKSRFKSGVAFSLLYLSVRATMRPVHRLQSSQLHGVAVPLRNQLSATVPFASFSRLTPGRSHGLFLQPSPCISERETSGSAPLGFLNSGQFMSYCC